jgi:hypothetical protein
VPLRSVEAATRDDAIAAAREQFGPSARVVGVRRVRSGGVLGFFATERYVAEVAPDVTAGPSVPVPAPTRAGAAGRLDEAPADFSSPLASAAPARARAAAPGRNGAAAWAAEAVRSADTAAPAPSAPAPSAPTRSAAPVTRSATPAWQAAPVHPAAAAPVRQPARADEDRVSELAGLLAAQQAESATPTYSRTTFPRASFPRTGRDGTTSVADDAVDERPARSGNQRLLPAAEPDAPSPFTAALARMVAGDRDVRQAVEEALEQPASALLRGTAEPRPTRSGRIAAAESSVPSPAARQEEETVGDQVIAPSATMAQPVEVPTWAAESESAATSGSSREEAIAEVLRSALAQGHSDEALAGILRKVLAGASPQTALTEPETMAPVPQAVLEDPVVPDVVIGTDLPLVLAPAAAEIAPAAPVVETRVVEARVVEARVVEAPVVEVPVVETPAVIAEPTVLHEAVATAAPQPLTSPAGSMWETPMSQAPLWGEAVTTASTRVVKADAPIWAEVVLQEPAAGAVREAVAEPAPVAVTPLLETVAETVAVAEQVQIPAGSQLPADLPAEAEVQTELEVAEETVEEHLTEAAVAEMAPMLARTASDPAPMMSLDSTTVMPPLSLLPPLPGSRGRGRPAVPPATSRPMAPSAPSTAPAASATPPAVDPAGPTTPESTAVPSSEGSPARHVPTPAQPTLGGRSLATVTRLPVAPLMATPETPEMPEHLFEPALDEAEPVAPRTAEPVVPAVIAPGDVAGRLEGLGVPEQLLGATFAGDVAEHGIYAALTRTLALRLPQAPELPSGAGEVLFVVGPGVETLRAAQTLAASLRLDPDRVQWATRGDLAGLAPQNSRVTTAHAAIDHQKDAAVAGTVTIVAVDAPMRTDAYWTAQMTAIWTPVAVWAVVEATRKPEDLEPWLDGLPRVDALIVQDTDLSADPAAVLRRVDAPVAILDGVRATPHRWASLLCERLENTKA